MGSKSPARFPVVSVLPRRGPRNIPDASRATERLEDLFDSRQVCLDHQPTACVWRRPYSTDCGNAIDNKIVLALTSAIQQNVEMDMPDTSTRAVGARLLAVREARGYIQGFVAQLLDISQSRWSNYERGERVIPHNLLFRFCSITGATADYILFGSIRGMPMDLLERLETGTPQKTKNRA